MLTRDRVHEQTSTRQQIAYRMQAESVIGPDEHLFKIEYVSTPVYDRDHTDVVAREEERHDNPITW